MPHRSASSTEEPGPQQLSLKNIAPKFVAAVLVGVAVALFIGVECFVTVGQLSAFRSRAFATRELLLSLNEVIKSVDDAETGQRGYVITGKDSYLQSYNAARSALPNELNGLESVEADRVSVALLNADISAKLAELQETIDLRRTKGYDAARAVIMTDRGQHVMDDIRSRISGMSLGQENSFDVLVQKISSLYQRLLILISLLISFELVLFFGVLVMILRDRIERVENGRIMSEQNERLREQRDNLNFANDHLEVAFRRFESLFQGVPVACCCIGPKGEILEWNRASEVLFGFSSDEAIKSNIYSTIIRPSRTAQAREFSAAVLSGQSFENVEWICRTKDGMDVEVMSNAMPLLGDDGAPLGVMTATINISERKEVERLKSEFVFTVSHELRAPLTAIRGPLGLICSGRVGELPDKVRRLCEIASNNTERLVRLINDILDIEKIDAGKLVYNIVDCSMAELAKNTVEEVRSYAESLQVNVELHAEDSDVTVAADRDRISQVLDNLLSNAIKFSPPDTDVIVEVQAVEGNVQVSVRDSGPGIPKDFQSRIFGRFAQADSADTRQKGGTGLGLSICKAIVERLNGRIWFETLDKGTRFNFTLPLSQGNRADASQE